MTYEEFKTKYVSAFEGMMSYAPNEVGSQVFAEKMAALADEYPGFADQVEEEAEADQYD